MEDKYLTLGSVVMLKGGKKAVMVIGYFASDSEIVNK